MFEVIMTAVVVLLGGGLLREILSSTKLKTEMQVLKSQSNLNEANEKKIIVSMAMELTEEVKEFYEIRIALLEQRIKELECRVDEQAQEIIKLKGS